jgi:hypothetical protein
VSLVVLVAFPFFFLELRALIWFWYKRYENILSLEEPIQAPLSYSVILGSRFLYWDPVFSFFYLTAR